MIYGNVLCFADYSGPGDVKKIIQLAMLGRRILDNFFETLFIRHIKMDGFDFQSFFK